MTQLLRRFGIMGLGGLLLASVGCKDEAAQQALSSCQDEIGRLRTNVSDQNAVIADLRSQLAKLQANAQEPAKTEGAAKTGQEKGGAQPKAKEDEQAKAGPAKDAGSATTEVKAKIAQMKKHAASKDAGTAKKGDTGKSAAKKKHESSKDAGKKPADP